MSVRYFTTLLYTFWRVFVTRYRYVIPFWLAIAMTIVAIPFIALRHSLGSGLYAESIISFLQSLLIVYDPAQIAAFSAALIASSLIDEISKGVLEHIIAVTQLSIGRILLLKSLCSVLVLLPMALCAVAIRILLLLLYAGPQYIASITVLSIVLLLLNSLSLTLTLANILTLSITLAPSRYRTAVVAGIGMAIVTLQQTIALSILSRTMLITVNSYVAYTSTLALICIASVISCYTAAEKLRSKIAMNILAT